MSSNNLCQGLVLQIDTVVEYIDLSVFCNKSEKSRWTVTRNEKTLALYINLNTHQRIFNRVFRCHQIVYVMV